jgi:hypothetical protein
MIKSLITKLVAWVTDLFTSKIIVYPETNIKRTRAPHKEVDGGALYYLDDLLDNLDNCFKCADYMKKADPAAWEIFRNTGITVGGRNTAAYKNTIEPYFLQHMPSLGCMYLGGELTSDKNSVRAAMIYFQKEKSPINVQYTNGIIYRMGYIMHYENHNLCAPFYIAVDPNGKINILKECLPVWRKFGDRNNAHGIYRMEWHTSRFLEEANRDANRLNKENITSLERAQTLFNLIANFSITQDWGVTVRATLGKITLTFSIDMLRTPYFFANREKTVNANGRTKRIFHIVRTHYRLGKPVKSHFRGIRKFKWGGYSINIIVADTHARAFSKFTGESVDKRTLESMDGYVDTVEMAETIGQHLNKS